MTYLGFGIITHVFMILYHAFTLLVISDKFSKQYNEILGYRWNSAWRVIRILWKSVPIESMLKFCILLKYYDLNTIKNQEQLERP